MYRAACKVEFQSFKRSFSQRTFFNIYQVSTAQRRLFNYHSNGHREEIGRYDYFCSSLSLCMPDFVKALFWRQISQKCIFLFSVHRKVTTSPLDVKAHCVLGNTPNACGNTPYITAPLLPRVFEGERMPFPLTTVTNAI